MRINKNITAVIAALFVALTSFGQTDVLGVEANSVLIDDFWAGFSSNLQGDNIILAYTINEEAQYDYNQVAYMDKASAVAQVIMQDATNDVTPNEQQFDVISHQLIINQIASNEQGKISIWVQKQLKRERIVVISLNENQTVSLISYDRNYYNTHVLGL